jgi:uncharacterized membrane protein
MRKLTSGILLWTGLTVLLAGPVILPQVAYIALVGAVIMVIGLILLWLDK